MSCLRLIYNVMAALVSRDGSTQVYSEKKMTIQTEVKIIISSSPRVGECHLRVSRLSEDSPSQVAMLSTISFMQSVGGQYLRILGLTEVGQDNVKTRPRRGVPDNVAPERLDKKEGHEVSSCYKQTTPTTIYISSDVMYNDDNDKMMVRVEFLILHKSDCTKKCRDVIPTFMFLLYKPIKDAEVFQEKQKEELRRVGYI